MIVVSDTTPIISLMKAGQLELLQNLFDVVYIPEAVYFELVENEAYMEEARMGKCFNFINIPENLRVCHLHMSFIIWRFFAAGRQGDPTTPKGHLTEGVVGTFGAKNVRLTSYTQIV